MSRPHRPRWRWATSLLLVCTGCTSYEPAPLPPGDLLQALERVGLEDVPRVFRAGPPARARDPGQVAATGSDAAALAFDPADGLTLVEASAAAVRLNPLLAALRAEVAVTDAQLVEAGLLPDIVVGWEAGNNIADFITEAKSGANSYLAGAFLEWPLPRPGEIDAKEGVARAEVDGARARVAAAEWALVREVHEAYVGLLVARARVEQLARLAAIAGRSLEYLQRARGLGAATAIDENLARVSANTTRADAVRAEAGERQARLRLNGLLGLPPGTAWDLQTTLDEVLAAAPLGAPEPEALVRRAVERRPDLLEAQAAYRRAEERLRLEVARQWPQVSIGTVFSITLPLFSRFNQPAIRSAERAREAAGRRLTVAVHQVRQEVHAALVGYGQAERLLGLYRDELEPALIESLRLSEQAFQVREVTPLQILTSQQLVIETRGRALEAQEGWAAARIRLQAATGDLLPALRFPAHDTQPAGGPP